MAEESYESELNRAELLGIEPQGKSEWESANKARKASQEIESTEEPEIVQDTTSKSDAKGKIDEILSSINQIRIDKFKKACGSLTNLLKIRGPDGGQPEDPSAGTSGGNEPDVDASLVEEKLG